VFFYQGNCFYLHQKSTILDKKNFFKITFYYLNTEPEPLLELWPFMSQNRNCNISIVEAGIETGTVTFQKSEPDQELEL